MAAKSRRTDSPLTEVLYERPYSFDFFQAVRLLERISPERLPVGRDGDSLREVVHFRSRASLAFPPSQLYQITHNGKDSTEPPEMTVAFMGMTGPLGVLPQQYTELVMERARHKDTALWAFLDLFTHRMLSFFYRAWEKHRFPIAYERGQFDQFTSYLFDIIGLGTRGLRGRLHQPDQGLLFYGGLIAQKPHSASAIAAILSDHFGVRAEVDQFAGQWLRLDQTSLSRLGAANSQLGVSTVAGARVWDDQSKFRLKLGPMPLKQFREFLPVGSAYKPIAALLRFLVGLEFDFDIQLILEKEEVPASHIKTRDEKQSRLGWTTWLKTQPFKQDDRQVVL
ncbi:MAG TPA: type VI secretion system baseplate subunit TssG [Pyrinomonadaceae bacterium]|jgi:type VI secretion system protein ImpH